MTGQCTYLGIGGAGRDLASPKTLSVSLLACISRVTSRSHIDILFNQQCEVCTIGSLDEIRKWICP